MVKKKKKNKAKKSKFIYSIYYQPTGDVVYCAHRPTKSELLKIAKKCFDWEDNKEYYNDDFTEFMGDISISSERLLTP